MVTHLYDSFAILPPTIAPDGGLILQFVETDEDGNMGEKHVFPISADAAREYHKQIGQKLSAKVDVANMQDMKRETRAVPTTPRR